MIGKRLDATIGSACEHALKFQLEFLNVHLIRFAFGRLDPQTSHLVKAPQPLRAGAERHGTGRHESGSLDLVQRDRGGAARSGFAVGGSIGRRSGTSGNSLKISSP